MSASTAARPASGYPWMLIICGCAIAALTFGPRSAMGFFQLPMLADKGWDRTTFGLAMAIQNLAWGLGQPIFGAMSDKFGTWRVLLASAILYSLGLYLMAHADSAGMLYLSGGVLIGLGVAGGSFTIIMAAFARNVTPDKRSFVFGLGTAAGSAGMFLFAPISQSMISTYGWSDTLVYFSIAMLIIPILAIPLIGNARSGLARAGEYEQSILEALREALGHRSYLLLTAGFFVCGFQLAFITVHFPPYIRDLGIDARYAVLALALIGFCNIIGSLAAGVISQRYSKPWFLTWIYLGRAISTAIFVLVPASPATVIAYSIVTGFLWLATVPPTNGLVAIMFGTRHLAMLGGVVFLSHQLGSFLGVWLGGYLYDHFGSYGPVWWLSVALAVLAAIVNWPIKEAPVARPALAPAA